MGRKILLLFFLFAFSACGASLGSLEVMSNDLSPPVGEGSAVFGHLLIDWQEKEPVIDTIDRLDPMILIVIHQSSGETYQIVCEPGGRDGRFFAPLPAGKYRVRKWSKGKDVRKMSESFEVRADQIGYIGTLIWFRGFFTAVQGNLLVEDDFEEEAELLKKNYPDVHGKIERAMMKSD
jgi:hypothetical protein